MSESSKFAFNQLGKTIVVAAEASAPAGVRATTFSNGSALTSGQYRIVNAGTNTVFLGVGATAEAAQANAVAPVAGTPSTAIVLVPGAVEVFSFGDGSFFSGLASSATTVYITPGQGL